MSITFYIAVRVNDETRFAYRCDCEQRWCDACDVAFAKDGLAPPMFTCADCTDVELNMANSNAVEWLRWVGLEADYGGQIEARDLAARCRRRLWDEQRNYDPAVEGADYKIDGGPRVIVADRRPNYLREQTERMLKICAKADDRLIAWA
jgi:hypothetical protein